MHDEMCFRRRVVDAIAAGTSRGLAVWRKLSFYNINSQTQTDVFRLLIASGTGAPPSTFLFASARARPETSKAYDGTIQRDCRLDN